MPGTGGELLWAANNTSGVIDLVWTLCRLRMARAHVWCPDTKMASSSAAGGFLHHVAIIIFADADKLTSIGQTSIAAEKRVGSTPPSPHSTISKGTIVLCGDGGAVALSGISTGSVCPADPEQTGHPPIHPTYSRIPREKIHQEFFELRGACGTARWKPEPT